MRGLPIQKNNLDKSKAWVDYYGHLITDEAKWALFSMLRDRRDKNQDHDAEMALNILVDRWTKEKST